MSDCASRPARAKPRAKPRANGRKPPATSSYYRPRSSQLDAASATFNPFQARCKLCLLARGSWFKSYCAHKAQKVHIEHVIDRYGARPVTYGRSKTMFATAGEYIGGALSACGRQPAEWVGRTSLELSGWCVPIGRWAVPAALLETKSYVPRPRRALVPRPRLSERLDRGSASKLMLVSASAGFGKTTLLTEWLPSPSTTR
jgi:hypothetical protein